MAEITVNEVLQAFSPAFKSIDLRIVAVKPEEQWTNVITSMFLSSKSPEEIKSEQQQVREKLMKTEKFCILLDCYPSNSISKLTKQIEKGEIRINGFSINSRALDLSKLRVVQFHPRFSETNRQMETNRLKG